MSRGMRGVGVAAGGRRLARAVRIVLGVVGVEAVVSLLAAWPHQWGGHGDQRHMLQDFVAHGTALAPPLTIIILLALLGLLAGRPGRRGLAAALALLPVGALMVVGAIGEAVAAASPDVPRALVALDLVNAALSAALVALAVAAVVGRARGRSLDHAGAGTGALA